MRPLSTAGMRRSATVAVVVVAVAWALWPLVYLFFRAGSHGTVFTGAQGPFPADQFQYMAWIRDESRHVLAADLFTLHGAGHVFLHPMFGLSAVLVRLGLGMRAAYLLWVPVAAAVLVLGVWAFVARTLPRRSWQRPAALALGLLFFTPVSLLSVNLHDTASELFSAGELAGYLPAALVAGLMSLYFVAVEPVLRADRWRRPALVATALAVAVAWVHPWQGVTLVVATAGLAVWSRDVRRAARLLPAVVGAALPLLYYAALPRFDAGWKISANAGVTAAAPGAFLLAVAPLAIPAAFGLKRRPEAALERLLWLWPAAAVTVYLLDLPGAGRGLVGLAVPLAVLAVRGCRRFPIPVTAVAVVLLIVPGMVNATADLRRIYDKRDRGYELTRDEVAALADLRSDRRVGGVVAPLPMASALPEVTGRAVWAGHDSWTPDASARGDTLRQLFDGTLSDREGRRALVGTGATFAVAPCGTSNRFTAYLPPDAAVVAAHGCVRVYAF